MINEEKILVKTTKNYSLGVTKFTSSMQKNKSIVISSATGVLQKYYKKISEHFASLGFTVYTFDYSGIGKSGSEIKNLKKNKSTLVEWGSIDQAALIKFAKEESPLNEIILITHSVGGQVLGFNPNYHLINKVITVASQSGYWKHFKGFHKPKMWLFWNVLTPILTPIFGYFPAKKLGLFENLPKGVVYDWRKWGKHKNYMMGYHSINETYYNQFKIPMLVLSFPRDSYAPKKTVDWLSNLFTNATVDRRHLIPNELKIEEIGHFGFFREKFSTSLWKMVDEWIKEN